MGDVGNPGAFNTLPFPMQVMMFQRMQAQMAEQARMQQARGQAGNALYEQFGQPQPQAPQQPPMLAAPPQAPNLAPAPPPGMLSPGGGNPAARQPAPPAPPAGVSAAGPSAAPQAPPPPLQPPQGPPPPFQAMPTEPPGGMSAGPGMVPPPPASAGPKPLDIGGIVMGLKKSGVAPEQVMNVLEQLQPTMNAQNQQQITALKAETAAQKAAAEAYKLTLDTYKAQEAVAQRRREEERRVAGLDERKRANLAKEELGRARLDAAAGGSGNVKSAQPIYGLGADGRADIAAGPVGTRGITKTGRIINIDLEGRVVPTLAGVTSGEAKATSVNVRDTVRGNLVEGSALNAMNRLKEIEEKHPTGTVSLLFGKSAGDSLLMGGLHAGVRGTQDKTQQDIDAKWASFIDEVIPVFTGGLRGSDAFRKFLIEQAPQPNTKPEVIAEKMRLFRENIAGTQLAFANKFKTDPSMWGPGVTKDQVKGGAAPKPAAGAGPKRIANDAEYNALPSGTEFTGPDGVKRRKP